MVLGIQNYYQLATCISIDCREFHRRVMTVLTNRLNTETGSMLKHEGGTITQAEKERFGQSKMIRYVSGIDQMIYPIAFIKNKIPMAKRSIVCSYTKEGRAPIHTELNLNQYVLKGLREKYPLVIAQNTMTVKYLYFLLKRENVQSVEKNSQMRNM